MEFGKCMCCGRPKEECEHRLITHLYNFTCCNRRSKYIYYILYLLIIYALKCADCYVEFASEENLVRHCLDIHKKVVNLAKTHKQTEVFFREHLGPFDLALTTIILSRQFRKDGSNKVRNYITFS